MIQQTKVRKWLTLSFMLVAISLTAILLRGCHSQSTIIVPTSILDSLKGLNNNLQENVTFWKDKYNREHASVLEIKANKDDLERYSKDIAASLNVKPKQIEAIHKMNTNIVLNEKLKVDTIFKPIIVGEPKLINQYDFSWSDKWMDIRGSIGDRDSVHVSGRDTITLTDYWKRKWFLGKKYHYADFSNSNKHIEILGGKSVSLSEPNKRWSFGPSINFTYPIEKGRVDIKKVNVTVGVSVQYTIFKL